MNFTPFTYEEFKTYRALAVEEFASHFEAKDGLVAEEAMEKAEYAFSKILPEGFTTKGHFFLKVKINNENVGVLWMRMYDHGNLRKAYIYGLQVHEEFRGQKYGKQILMLAEHFAKSYRTYEMACYSHLKDDYAFKLFEEAGYTFYDQSELGFEFVKELFGKTNLRAS